MQAPARSSLIPTLIIGALFFIFGFVTWLNGTLIQYLRLACNLSYTQSFYIASAFYASYFFLALPSSWILKKTGFKNGMMLGLFIMAFGALLFIPAAMTRMYGVFLTGQFIIGTGLCILQTAANPYVTVVGPIESAARRISIMGICNKVAGALAPWVLSALVLSDATSLQAKLNMLTDGDRQILAARVILPYLVMAAVLVGLGLLILLSPLPKIEAEEESITENKDEDAAKLLDYPDQIKWQRKNVFEFPNLVLGVVALFLYVGAEVIAGDSIGSYGALSGFSLEQTKHFTSYTLIAMIVGYVIGIFSIPKLISQSRALTVSAVTGILFTLIVVFTTGYPSVLFVALLGLANALMWPAIWPLAISGLGRFTKTGSALLIMAILGGAVLTPLWGYLTDYYGGPRVAYTILLPCYLFILFYSVRGYRISKW